MSHKQLTENVKIPDLRHIAKMINRHPSTISREIKRNSGQRGYRPAQAQKLSDNRRREAYKAFKVTEEVKE